MTQKDTKLRILDAAERLFAEHGIAGTSLREITTAARANLAAVNYHFRTKEALVDAVFSRRLDPANRERIEMLEACEAPVAGGEVPVEEIVDAVLAPFLRRFIGTPFTALIGRIHSEPGDLARRFIAVHMTEVARRFGAALRRALPGLPEEELFWRMHFSIGVLAHTLAGSQALEVLSQGKCVVRDVEAIRRRMVAFVSAGLRAEASERVCERSAC